MKARKLCAPFAVFVLIITLALSATGIQPKAYADNVPSPYTATLRYYDDIQITYTLTYPTGGIWNGAGDIPIGGTGASSQIYCVDPFIHFHSVATTSWDTSKNATLDIMGGYVAAAPWATSATMQKNSDAIRWLLYNGYRGDYLANNQESIDSVTRLNALYPGVPGTIDKRIALMATKVAIWKTLVGDDVVILRTSLTTAQQATFDALVNAMVADALDFQDNIGGSLGETELIVTIQESGFPYVNTVGTYEYYGPMTVTADLLNSPSGDITTLLDGVFLSVSGPNSGGVELVDSTYTPLPTDTLYGTAITNAYLENADFSLVGADWTSQEFYLAVPVGRQPPDADHLTIQARAKAAAVPLAAGTPMTFIYDNGGIQDWEYVQAYAGVAEDGMAADLYGEARSGNGDLGTVEVMKYVENATPFDEDSQFVFSLYHSDIDTLDADADIVDLRDYVVSSAFAVSADGQTFTLKNGGRAIIDGLPQDGYYWVEEVFSPLEYNTTYIEILNAAVIPPLATARLTDPFEMDDDFALVRFTNSKSENKAYLFVSKRAFADVSGTPQPVQNTPYYFFLEGSDDGGVTWAPVDLTGVFKSDDGIVLSAVDGNFSLETHDMAFIEVEPNLLYRIIETDPGANYTAMYLYEHAEPDAGGWIHNTDSHVGADWYYPAVPAYITEEFAAVEGGYYWITVANLRALTENLTLSKTLAGPVTDDDKDQLFRFEVFIMDNDFSIPPGLSIPVSVDPAPDTFHVSGITQDRIVNNAAGIPSIILLKHGESATIEALPSGSYKVCETLDTKFTTTYAVAGGALAPVSASGETADFDVYADTTVAFVNTLKTGPGPQDDDDDDGGGGGGDDGNGGGGGGGDDDNGGGGGNGDNGGGGGNGDNGGGGDGNGNGGGGGTTTGSGSGTGTGDGNSTAPRTGDALVPIILIAVLLVLGTALAALYSTRSRFTRHPRRH
ncbi:MAG: Cys-Gln thioester bond-forming surface protein [Coriobacteriia bacterium]|nr:Cys-Gln thioester bond-forming surface protein [Coriobacteriia bacterium]